MTTAKPKRLFGPAMEEQLDKETRFLMDTDMHPKPGKVSVQNFPIEQLLMDARSRLGLGAAKRQASFYSERLHSHLSGDKPSKRLARILGRWRHFPFTLAVDGVPCDSGLAALVLHVRQVCDAVDEDEDEVSVLNPSPAVAERAQAPKPIRCAKEGWLTIRQVAEMLDLSYSQARQRMLDGRIKTYKDGKHIRTKKEWVDEYIQGRLIDGPDHSAEVSLGRKRRPKPATVKPKGIGLRFLQNRKS